MMIVTAPQPLPREFIFPRLPAALPRAPTPSKQKSRKSISPPKKRAPSPDPQVQKNEARSIEIKNTEGTVPRPPSPTPEEEQRRITELTLYAFENEWAFWYDKYPGPGLAPEEYKKALVCFGSFDCIPDFWRWINNMVEPERLGARSSLHLMKNGIYPLWEDEANANGGEVVIKIDKADTTSAWLAVLLAIVGEQFSSVIMSGDDICGATVNVRRNETCISIWNRSIAHFNMKAIEATLRNVLKGIRIRQVSYKVHKDEIEGASH